MAAAAAAAAAAASASPLMAYTCCERPKLGGLGDSSSISNLQAIEGQSLLVQHSRPQQAEPCATVKQYVCFAPCTVPAYHAEGV
jgi:hypothetical protein